MKVAEDSVLLLSCFKKFCSIFDWFCFVFQSPEVFYKPTSLSMLQTRLTVNLPSINLEHVAITLTLDILLNRGFTDMVVIPK